jgi:hypothetical protein
MRVLCVILSLWAVYPSAATAQQAAVVIENPHLRYTISAEGKNLAFVDRATGMDYLKRAHRPPAPRRAAKARNILRLSPGSRMTG